MELSTIQSRLSATEADDWHVVDSGTTYRIHTYSAIEQHAFGGAIDGGIQHDQTACFRAEVALTIAWGMSAAYLDSGPQPWARFADEQVTPFVLDVFWTGSLVDRQTFCHVDGYRAILPWPKFNYISGEGTDMGVVVPPTATPNHVAVARLLDTLSGGSEFDRYLRQSGIIVTPEDD